MATYAKNKTEYEHSDPKRVFIQDDLHGTDEIAEKNVDRTHVLMLMESVYFGTCWVGHGIGNRYTLLIR